MDICTDLDGVLANSYPELEHRVLHKTGIHIPCEEWSDPTFENLFPIVDRSWVSEQFTDPAFWKNVEPFHREVDWLKRMARKHRIHIITARYESCIDITKEWVKKHKIPNVGIYHVPAEEKHEMLHVINPKYMVEDNPHTAHKISTTGTKCYIINRSYNVDWHVGKAIRIDSMYDIGVK